MDAIGEVIIILIIFLPIIWLGGSAALSVYDGLSNVTDAARKYNNEDQPQQIYVSLTYPNGQTDTHFPAGNDPNFCAQNNGCQFCNTWISLQKTA